MLLDIKKIGENFYLVNGEYTASSFNEAVVLAYENKKMKNFGVDYMEISFLEKFKNKINFIFKLLESWMWFYGYFKTSFGCSYGRERSQKWGKQRKQRKGK